MSSKLHLIRYGWGLLRRLRISRRTGGVARLLICSLGLVSCDALNPAFVNVVDPEGSSGAQTLSNAPGHVIIAVVNDAEVDERLLNYLESQGLDLTEAEKQNLHPRIRLRLRITFRDGSQQIIEYVTGSAELVDPAFRAQAAPDLNQNRLENAVVICDVARVEADSGSPIEVFIPVQLNGYELVETGETGGGNIIRQYELREQIPPQFRTLQVDQIDEDGDVTLQQNIGIRDVPSPAANLPCGSVVAVVVRGVLTVPFLDGVDTNPSYDRADVATEATIGGRYEFRTGVH